MFYSQLAMCLTRRISFHIYQWVMFCCVKKGILKSPKRKGENERDREKKSNQTKPKQYRTAQHNYNLCI